jgi:hypothetical protein
MLVASSHCNPCALGGIAPSPYHFCQVSRNYIASSGTTLASPSHETRARVIVREYRAAQEGEALPPNRLGRKGAGAAIDAAESTRKTELAITS